MINTTRYLPRNVVNYINTYPAFEKDNGGIIDSDFWAWGFNKLQLKSLNEAFDRISRAIWHCSIYKEATMEEAKEFLKTIEPYWCEFKEISSTGFFGDELETFDEDDMLDI